MPHTTTKPKTRVRAGQPVVAAVGYSSEALSLEQRKKQAEEPIYLNRM